MTDDDIGQLLIDSIEAIHRENTRRPIPCRYCPGLWFLKADHLFRHHARHHGNHPSLGRSA